MNLEHDDPDNVVGRRKVVIGALVHRPRSLEPFLGGGAHRRDRSCARRATMSEMREDWRGRWDGRPIARRRAQWWGDQDGRNCGIRCMGGRRELSLVGRPRRQRRPAHEQFRQHAAGCRRRDRRRCARVHDRRRTSGSGCPVLNRASRAIDVDPGWRDVETGQPRNRDVVIIVII